MWYCVWRRLYAYCLCLCLLLSLSLFLFLFVSLLSFLFLVCRVSQNIVQSWRDERSKRKKRKEREQKKNEERRCKNNEEEKTRGKSRGRNVIGLSVQREKKTQGEEEKMERFRSVRVRAWVCVCTGNSRAVNVRIMLCFTRTR